MRDIAPNKKTIFDSSELQRSYRKKLREKWQNFLDSYCQIR